ncbi:MAG: hypothetical protein ACKVWV_05725 [Planctomycetota bacterium]
MSDRQEQILSTSAILADTDGDGFGDCEELARKTSPLHAQLRPVVERVSVGTSVHGDRWKLRWVIALYLPDATMAWPLMTLGAQAGGRIIDLSRHQLLQQSTVTVVSAHDQRASVVLIDIPIPPQFVRAFGEVTFFTVMSSDNGSMVSSALARLLRLDGMTVIVQPDGTTTASAQQWASSTGSASVYRPVPLDEEDEVPSNWTQDQICSQRSSPVGMSGPLITQEVTSAECQDGWDSSCPPSCSSSVGSTHTTIDPVVLIGG